jgi:hypothetical protein
MSTPNAEAGAISFAHLAGITTPVHAAKADAPEDKKDAAASDDDESMEDDEPKKDDGDKKEDAKAESDEPDEDDEPKKAKKASVSGVSRGVAQERARWTAVLGSKSFARNPAIAARLLANTSMDAPAIISALHDTPAAVSPDAARATRNPNLGTSAPAVAVSTDTRWGAAFKRAGVSK